MALNPLTYAAPDSEIVVEERDSRKPLGELNAAQIAHLSHGTQAALGVAILGKGTGFIFEHLESGAWLSKPVTITVCDAWHLAAHMMKCMEGGAK